MAIIKLRMSDGERMETPAEIVEGIACHRVSGPCASFGLTHAASGGRLIAYDFDSLAAAVEFAQALAFLASWPAFRDQATVNAAYPAARAFAREARSSGLCVTGPRQMGLVPAPKATALAN